MRHYLVLSHDEACDLPYALICSTHGSAVWDTGTRKRRWKCEFTPREREASFRIFRQCSSWYLVHGVPNEVEMTMDTLLLWRKLGDFCASL